VTCNKERATLQFVASDVIHCDW